MWMGGIPPLGYEPDGRTLAIVEEHAAVIRDVFARYLALGNVQLLAEQMQEAGITVPVRTLATGRTIGGGVFTRGQIYRILSNPIYLGEVHHNGKVYDGRHEAIIDRETWDRTQRKLADNRQGTERSGRGTSRRSSLVPSLLRSRQRPCSISAIFRSTGRPRRRCCIWNSSLRLRHMQAALRRRLSLGAVVPAKLPRWYLRMGRQRNRRRMGVSGPLIRSPADQIIP